MYQDVAAFNKFWRTTPGRLSGKLGMTKADAAGVAVGGQRCSGPLGATGPAVVLGPRTRDGTPGPKPKDDFNYAKDKEGFAARSGRPNGCASSTPARPGPFDKARVRRCRACYAGCMPTEGKLGGGGRGRTSVRPRGLIGLFLCFQSPRPVP